MLSNTASYIFTVETHSAETSVPDNQTVRIHNARERNLRIDQRDSLQCQSSHYTSHPILPLHLAATCCQVYLHSDGRTELWGH